MKKTIITLIVIAAIAGSAGRTTTPPRPEPKVLTAQTGRGDIIESVSATGTLDAVTAVAGRFAGGRHHPGTR